VRDRCDGWHDCGFVLSDRLLRVLVFGRAFLFGGGLGPAVFQSRIQPVEALSWSWKKAWAGLAFALFGGLMMGLYIGPQI
jgi:hypothetical protein